MPGMAEQQTQGTAGNSGGGAGSREIPAPGRRRSGAGSALPETVYARLRESILAIPPRGERRLVEDELAERLRVSRTPVREALLRLEQEGLVERNRGWLVREYDPAEIRARIECRIGLEGFAACLAASRRSEAQLAELRFLESAMREQGASPGGPEPRGELERLNDRFHMALIAAAGNPCLVSIHAQLRMEHCDLSFHARLDPAARRRADEDHRLLVEALGAREGAEAERITRAHIGRTLDALVGRASSYM